MNRRKDKNEDTSPARFGGESTHTSAATPTSSVVENIALKIPTTKVEEYWGNPRTYENPKIETSKESTREVGVYRRLIVTKRPEDEKFTCCYGGNTRLRCLRELYEKKKDL